MPLYDYKCGCGHTTEVLAKSRTDTVPCAACGEDARPMVSAPSGFVGVSNTKAHQEEGESHGWRTTDMGSFVVKEKGAGTIPAYKQGLCLTCMNRSPCVFLDAHGDPEACGHCGGTDWRLEDVEYFRSEVTYPHYNRGLGCTVESPSHLRRLMKERGLVDARAVDVVDADERVNRAIREEEQEFEREQAHTMGRPEIRKAMESPQYRNLLKQVARAI